MTDVSRLVRASLRIPEYESAKNPGQFITRKESKNRVLATIRNLTQRGTCLSLLRFPPVPLYMIRSPAVRAKPTVLRSFQERFLRQCTQPRNCCKRTVFVEGRVCAKTSECYGVRMTDMRRTTFTEPFAFPKFSLEGHPCIGDEEARRILENYQDLCLLCIRADVKVRVGLKLAFPDSEDPVTVDDFPFACMGGVPGEYRAEQCMFSERLIHMEHGVFFPSHDLIDYTVEGVAHHKSSQPIDRYTAPTMRLVHRPNSQE